MQIFCIRLHFNRYKWYLDYVKLINRWRSLSESYIDCKNWFVVASTNLNQNTEWVYFSSRFSARHLNHYWNHFFNSYHSYIWDCKFSHLSAFLCKFKKDIILKDFKFKKAPQCSINWIRRRQLLSLRYFGSHL